MADLIKIPDYTEFTSKLLEQYKDANKLKAVVSAAFNRANDIETALFEIQNEYYLYNAVGAQLDVLGAIFVVDRLGRSDADYRKAIQDKALQHYSGEPESIIAAVKAIYGATFVYYSPNYPAGYHIYSDAIGLTGAALTAISPAGVDPLGQKALATADGKYLVTATGKKICTVL